MLLLAFEVELVVGYDSSPRGVHREVQAALGVLRFSMLRRNTSG